MSSVWDERADVYRQSEAHREGVDLDLVVEWALGARTALDVATGGGHVARRFREAGLEVTSCDPSPAMRPDVVCRAEELPFRTGASTSPLAGWPRIISRTSPPPCGSLPA